MTAVATLATPMPRSPALPPTEHGPATMDITGRAADGGMLGGYFEPAHFVVAPDGHLVADGAAWGSVSRPGALQTKVDEQITLPVDWGQATATCRMMDLAVGPADLPMAATTMHVDQMVLNVSMPQGPGSRLLLPLCAMGNLLKQRPLDEAQLATVLNAILALLGQAG